jgi:hypothetical protein
MRAGIHQKHQSFKSGRWLTYASWCNIMIWLTVAIIPQRRTFSTIKQCYMQLGPWLVFLSVFFFFFFCCAWDQMEGLVHARQTLPLSYVPNPLAAF